jgi:hypothetical protein
MMPKVSFFTLNRLYRQHGPEFIGLTEARVGSSVTLSFARPVQMKIQKYR